MGAEHRHANATYWFERELRQYPSTELNFDALDRYGDRIVLVAGEQSRGYPTYQAAVELGRRLGRPVIETSGGHIACVSHPVEFSQTLRHALAGG